MAERAAHLVDHVFPDVPIRQWVLTLPHRLRYAPAWRHDLCRKVACILDRAIGRASLRRPSGDGAAEQLRGVRVGLGAFRQLPLLMLTILRDVPLDADFNYNATDFATVVAPTLMFVGDRDVLVPVDEAAAMYRQLGRAELAAVPDADHSAFFFAYVATLQALILGFLERHNS